MFKKIEVKKLRKLLLHLVCMCLRKITLLFHIIIVILYKRRKPTTLKTYFSSV